jgi:CBS domain-containing protein
MFDEPVRSVMQRRKVLKAAPETLVVEAAKLMAKKNVGAVMVVEDACLIGIFTERDIAFRVVAQGLDAGTTRIADVMTRAPDTVHPDKPFGHALMKMHERGVRHLPVIEHGKVVGIVSARNAMDPALEEYEFEARRREYYRDEG